MTGLYINERRARGEELELERSERIAYWQMSGDDVPWLPAAALPDGD